MNWNDNGLGVFAGEGSKLAAAAGLVMATIGGAFLIAGALKSRKFNGSIARRNPYATTNDPEAETLLQEMRSALRRMQEAMTTEGIEKFKQAGLVASFHAEETSWDLACRKGLHGAALQAYEDKRVRAELAVMQQAEVVQQAEAESREAREALGAIWRKARQLDRTDS